MAAPEPHHLLELAFVSDPQVAPSGDAVAIVVTRIEEDEDGVPRYRSRIHLFDPGVGEQGAVEGGYSDSWPRFSPDGRSLAFLSRADRDARNQLWSFDMGESTVRGLTDEPCGVKAFDWSPDGLRIAYLVAPEGPEEKPPVARRIDRLAHKLDGKGYLPERPALLKLLRLGGSTSEVDWLPEGMDVEELAWAGDGQSLIVTSAASQAERDEALRRMWRVWPAQERLEQLVGPMHLSAPSPQPDGDEVAFLAPANEDDDAGPAAVWLVDGEGGQPVRLTGRDDDLAPATGGDGRYGDYPQRPVWLGRDRLLVNRNSRGSSRLATLQFDSENGALGGQLRDLSREEAVVTSFGARSGLAAFTLESPDRPGELFTLDLRDEGSASRRLSGFNDELLEGLELLPATGPFVPDPGSGASYWRIDPARPRPDRSMVLQVHGGPHTNSGFGFYLEFQLLAGRGYTVVYGNPRGSSSYGYDFATAILGSYGSVDADDLHSFVDHALANHPRSDAPVHLTGGSYGGFMTNWLIANGNRFRSAVTQRSICNFLSFYGTSDIGYWFGERELHGNSWKDQGHLWQQSPLRLVDRVETPLLILHAESDLRCPVEQAQQLFVALKRAGRTETRLVLFPEESHELSRSGRPDRRIRRLEEIIGWFESHP